MAILGAGLSAPLIATLTGCASRPGPRVLAPTQELSAPPLGRDPFNLIEVARAHIDIAESTRPDLSSPEAWSRLWGRIGGSRAEGASGDLLETQLRPWVHGIGQEGFSFEAHRPDVWRMTISGETVLQSAVPAPMGARFSDGQTAAPLHVITQASDWALARGRWAYIPAAPGDGLRRNPAHDAELYIRAVKEGAAGLIFSLPTPAEGVWQSVVLANPNAPDVLRTFETDFYPIPCFSVDAADGARLLEGARIAAQLGVDLIQEPSPRRNGANIVGVLRAERAPVTTSTSPAFASLGRLGTTSGSGAIAFFANLDAPFSGATENASGLATLVGLAQQLATGPRFARRGDIYFVGLSAHHDGAAGLRAFAEADPSRMAKLRQIYFLQRTSAASAPGVGPAQDSAASSSERVAFMGQRSWGDLARAIPEIFQEAGFEGQPPQLAKSAGTMSDPVVETRRARTFCLHQAPPYAFTSHDTADKLDAGELERSTDFHLRVIETAGALVPGTYREALRVVTRNRA